LRRDRVIFGSTAFVHLLGKGRVCFIKHTFPNVARIYMLRTIIKTLYFACSGADRRFLTTHKKGSSMAQPRHVLKRSRPCSSGYFGAVTT
jgi:hypothetical protein